MKFKAGLILCFCIAGLPSCKSRGMAGRSQIKHDFGKTTAKRDKAPDSCQDSGLDTPLGQYIKALVDHIIDRNPEAFRGNTSRKHICIQAVNNGIFGASMLSSSGSLMFHSGTLGVEAFQNDATIASIISHELAHFTMNHPSIRPNNFAPKGYDQTKEATLRREWDDAKKQHDDALLRFYRDIIESSEFKKAHRAIENAKNISSIIPNPAFPKLFLDAYSAYLANPTLKSAKMVEGQVSSWFSMFDSKSAGHDEIISEDARLAVRSIRERFTKQDDALEPYKDTISQAEKKFDLHRMPITQFEEEEADNVGFEFYVRAGFNPDSFAEAFLTMAKMTKSKSNCSPEVPLTGEPARFIRGEDDYQHPNFCWRYFETKVTERREHEEDYAQFISSSPIVNLPDLDKLRAAAIASLKK